MKEESLITYNRQGLIPGPDETEAEFLARAAYCLSLKSSFEERTGQTMEEEQFPLPHALTLKWFDIAPEWVPVMRSNHKLFPWQGGAAWIFRETETAPLSAFLQLRRKIWGNYTEEEILAHEMAHVGRMAFEEPNFEEMLAYQTSRRLLPRIFGPIVKSSGESLLFILSCFLPLIHFPLILISLTLLLYGVIRLRRRAQTFHKCVDVLRQLYPAAPEHILYRLTDREITAFSTMTPAQITVYANEAAQADLRWRQMIICYLS
ncbi:MAG: hypothetical protein KDK65_03215 [Chlamydiia bacterium]|nr:hypothetical protein [Chlamydiia bacterium]